MELHWPGYRKVRGMVCKRIEKRRRALGLASLDAYRGYLGEHREEWEVLGAACAIPISRFFRDRAVFENVEQLLLPELARNAERRFERSLACWSVGCASGEEPYSLSILWQLRLAQRWPGLVLRVLATDVDQNLLERAATGCYGAGSLKEVREDWLAQAFDRQGSAYCVRPPMRAGVTFARYDIRQGAPPGRFDLILCRNLVLTYFEPALQRAVMGRLAGALHPGGALVIGMHESLPDRIKGLEAWTGTRAIFRSVRDGFAPGPQA